jgi:Uma2 family endonuclease
MALAAKIPVRMTVDEFLKWDSEDWYRYELVDGEPRAMAPASTIHGFLQSELGRLIGNHLIEKTVGCEVVANPGVVPRLLSDHNVRIPDLAVTCSPLAPGQAILPDPVLLIEYSPPATRQRPGLTCGLTPAFRASGKYCFCAPIACRSNCCGGHRGASGPSNR